MRATKCSVFTRPMQDIRQCLYAKSVKNYMVLKESIAITNVDLAIERLGIRVATITLKLTKRKFSASGISNFDCHSWSARNASLNGFFAVLSFFGIKHFCRVCSCIFSLRDVRESSKAVGGAKEKAGQRQYIRKFRGDCVLSVTSVCEVKVQWDERAGYRSFTIVLFALNAILLDGEPTPIAHVHNFSGTELSR